MHYIPLCCTSSPCNLLFLNLGVYGLVQATVGVGSVLIWHFAVALQGRDGGGGGIHPEVQPASSFSLDGTPREVEWPYTIAGGGVPGPGSELWVTLVGPPMGPCSFSAVSDSHALAEKILETRLFQSLFCRRQDGFGCSFGDNTGT